MKRNVWILWIALVVVALAGVAMAARQAWYRNTPAGQRQALLEQLQPVALANCDLKRFGEANDGGYLLCANLLKDVQSAYSYGISGYDGWGCDISRQLNVKVHEYDCFNLVAPVCDGGALMFHAECVGGSRANDSDGRVFDTPEAQIERNGDAGRYLVMKIDVEGAEWDTFMTLPDSVLGHIDQLAVEFHGTNRVRARQVIAKLKQTFYVANLHFNNYGCKTDVPPFPSWAYEVSFVNKRVGILDRSKPADFNHANAPNNPAAEDCQSVSWIPWFRWLAH